jgi:hypothetical protein
VKGSFAQAYRDLEPAGRLTHRNVRQQAHLVEKLAAMRDPLYRGGEPGYPLLSHYAQLPVGPIVYLVREKLAQPKSSSSEILGVDPRFVVLRYHVWNHADPAGYKPKNHALLRFLVPRYSWQALHGLRHHEIIERLLLDSIGHYDSTMPTGGHVPTELFMRDFPSWRHALGVPPSAKWAKTQYEFSRANLTFLQANLGQLFDRGLAKKLLPQFLCDSERLLRMEPNEFDVLQGTYAVPLTMLYPGMHLYKLLSLSFIQNPSDPGGYLGLEEAYREQLRDMCLGNPEPDLPF